MPRAAPIESLNIVGALEGLPEKVIGSFVESNQQEKFFVKPPNWDSPGDAIELLALQNDREHHDMLSTQAEMRESAQRQVFINQGRIDEIRKMQLSLRRRFIDANNFFKECDDKRRGADEIVKQEKMMHEKLKEEIRTAKDNVQLLLKFRSDLKATVAQFEPYEAVINQVVAQSDIWKSVKDCTDSCDALMLTQVEIGEMKHQKIIEIEELRLQLVKLTTDAAATLLGLNNELTQLDRAYGIACHSCLKWEKIFANVKDAIDTNKLYSARMRDEILLMYRIICKRRGIECVPRKFTMEQLLDFIRDEINILNEVYKLCTAPKRRGAAKVRGSRG